MPPQEKKELLVFLRENINVFAWSVYEASGVDLGFICHHLNVNPMVIPKKKPPRRSSKEHAKAVKEKVSKLKRDGAIKQVFYLEWLASTFVVKKKLGKWKVCMDFTDLKKVVPRIPFQFLGLISWLMLRSDILG